MSKEQFGMVTDLYVWVAVLIVILTYGMETSFFYHASRSDKMDNAFRTAVLSLLITTGIFYGLFELNIETIARLMRYESTPHYLRIMVWILCLDVLAALPFARLRLQGRAVKFVSVKFSLIIVNVVLNLLLFKAKEWFNLDLDFLPNWLQGDLVGYVLVVNLIASSTMLLLLLGQFKPLLSLSGFDNALWRKMIVYGLPLMLAGLAGIANELADRQFLKYLLPAEGSLDEVGIYGAVYKLSIFIMLFVQAYRYAAEPFFFRLGLEKNGKDMNSKVLRYYTIFLGGMLIALNASLPLIKGFIDEKFWVGLSAAPVLFAANFVLGLNAHLSIWYKLENKTWYAGIITGAGLVVTITLNLWLVPNWGWMGAAWATLASYSVMASLNGFFSSTRAGISYNWKVFFLYFFSSLLLGFFAWKWQEHHGLWSILLVAPYLMLVLLLEQSTWREWLKLRK